MFSSRGVFSWNYLQPFYCSFFIRWLLTECHLYQRAVYRWRIEWGPSRDFQFSWLYWVGQNRNRYMITVMQKQPYVSHARLGKLRLLLLALKVLGQIEESPECQRSMLVRSTNGLELCARGPPWCIYFVTKWERDGEDGKERAWVWGGDQALGMGRKRWIWAE